VSFSRSVLLAVSLPVLSACSSDDCVADAGPD